MLLDGTMQDYTIAVTKRGVTITNSTGEVDTVKNVEVFHFSDGTNYLVGRHGLVQTGDQTINTFLADSGVDQSLFQGRPHGADAASQLNLQVRPAQMHPRRVPVSAARILSEHPKHDPEPHSQQHNGSFGGVASDSSRRSSQALIAGTKASKSFSPTRLSGTRSMPHQTTQRTQTPCWLI